MPDLKIQTVENTRRLAANSPNAAIDKTMVENCIDAYGNFIWTLARKFTASIEEAEKVTEEIFNDIWRYTERAGQPQLVEGKLVEKIARRRLLMNTV